MTQQPSVMKKMAVALLATSMLAGSAMGAAAAKPKDNAPHGKGNAYGKIKSSYKLEFKDVSEKQLQWAYQNIIRLAAKGVFSGYEDGSFKPQNNITRVEALVAAVRLLGLQAEAEKPENMNANLNFKDFDKLKKKYGWAVGYVAVALQNDLFSENDTSINPEQPATRLWASILLVKALKLDSEAKAKMGADLPFRDEDEIPAGSVGYIAEAVDKGLISGYEMPKKWNDYDGTDSKTYKVFLPNKPVTRAELAALLDRVDEQLPEKNDALAITGVVQSVAGGTIAVKKSDNTTIAVALDPNVFVFRNGVKSPSTAIVAGDEVLVRTYEGKAVFIEVTKLATPIVQFVEVGKVESFSLNSQQKLATITMSVSVNGVATSKILNVDPNVTISGGNGILSSQSIIVAKGENGVVKTIEIQGAQ
ncbi:S-layer homology domain-containing protein [Cohnella panacarvi]|uniref:S-layer homology domain-containing protein n=1 Tax=Cohnella panacarvi TaxID=400776 RepID=UPI00047BAA00|nr:S-layer homology domain-containing protein [Cohnella panacarvi]